MQRKQQAMKSPYDLTLRSGPQGRVSKDGTPHLACCPSFETRRGVYPEALEGRRSSATVSEVKRFAMGCCL